MIVSTYETLDAPAKMRLRRVVKAKVRLGSAILTQYFGDESWKERIVVSKLLMIDSCSCILGQLFGEYVTGLDVLEIDRFHEAYAYGFNPCKGDTPGLREAWIKELKR